MSQLHLTNALKTLNYVGIAQMLAYSNNRK